VAAPARPGAARGRTGRRAALPFRSASRRLHRRRPVGGRRPAPRARRVRRRGDDQRCLPRGPRHPVGPRPGAGRALLGAAAPQGAPHDARRRARPRPRDRREQYPVHRRERALPPRPAGARRRPSGRRLQPRRNTPRPAIVAEGIRGAPVSAAHRARQRGRLRQPAGGPARRGARGRADDRRLRLHQRTLDHRRAADARA
jgi:hypothetical protein